MSASRPEINRANAQRSTGPTSEQGKARSSQNSFKHGLYSKKVVIQGEDAAELDRLREELRTEHQPANETESILVNEIAEQFWRLRRMREFEARAFSPENLDGWIESGILPIILRNMASAERGFHKALASLRRLQQDRGFVPSKCAGETGDPQESSGFVSQKDDNISSDIGFVSQIIPTTASVAYAVDADLTISSPVALESRTITSQLQSKVSEESA